MTADVGGLVDAALSEQPGARKSRAVARLISMVEDAAPDLREVARLLAPHPGNADVIGLTGPPGVGKSSLTSALVTKFREQGKRVAVLAVDPTSPFTGGALLGDRVRMQEHATDPGVFIRSMATRGHLGGLAWATPQALRVLSAAGFEVVLVETVGVGQSEVEIAGQADATVVLLAPGMGDSIQVAKAGVLEVGDIYVVNKADRDDAERVSRDLRQMLHLAGKREWEPPIVKTIATDGKGVDLLVDSIGLFFSYGKKTGARARRRRERTQREIETMALTALRERIGALPADVRIEDLAEQVLAGRMDPYVAADEIIGYI